MDRCRSAEGRGLSVYGIGTCARCGCMFGCGTAKSVRRPSRHAPAFPAEPVDEFGNATGIALVNHASGKMYIPFAPRVREVMSYPRDSQTDAACVLVLFVAVDSVGRSIKAHITLPSTT